MSEPASALLTNTGSPEEAQKRFIDALQQEVLRREVDAHNETKRQLEELRVKVQKLKKEKNMYKDAYESVDRMVDRYIGYDYDDVDTKRPRVDNCELNASAFSRPSLHATACP